MTSACAGKKQTRPAFVLLLVLITVRHLRERSPAVYQTVTDITHPLILYLPEANVLIKLSNVTKWLSRSFLLLYWNPPPLHPSTNTSLHSIKKTWQCSKSSFTLIKLEALWMSFSVVRCISVYEKCTSKNNSSGPLFRERSVALTSMLVPLFFSCAILAQFPCLLLFNSHRLQLR